VSLSICFISDAIDVNKIEIHIDTVSAEQQPPHIIFNKLRIIEFLKNESMCFADPISHWSEKLESVDTRILSRLWVNFAADVSEEATVTHPHALTSPPNEGWGGDISVLSDGSEEEQSNNIQGS
jgi:hypothetical protein